MADSGSPSGSAAPKPKRSFFKQPSWATKKSDKSKDDEDPTAMFDGSRSTFSEIVAEQGRQRRTRLTEREKHEIPKTERKDSRESKRRRISDKTEESSDEEDWVKSELGSKKKQITSASRRANFGSPVSPPAKRRPSSQSLHYEDNVSAHKEGQKQAVVVDLGSSSGDDEPHPAAAPKPKENSVPKDEDDDISESDPELREIIRESRRKRRLAQQAKTMQGAPSVNIGHSGSTPSTGPNTPNAANAPPDPSLKIFVNPRIPNTKPLIVTRKLSQRMKEVREAWCKRQGFDRETSEMVFFTFRGIRLYDVATGRSLGLTVNSEGHLAMNGRQDAFDDEGGKVEVEAWTQELFDEDKKAARQITEPQPEIDDEEPPPEQKKDQIKVVIKSREYNECKLIVKPTTTFERMANAYHNRMQLPEEKKGKFYFAFDGDRLDPTQTMAELDDFEDGDSLEVFFGA
ncbi:uncharacterized protein K452DRAFT_358592 [Aplosporella prunicola CBS 121167]|uniref:Rad60/SUMO-like domain-containing protein n=1 Tax=Aplosporella prunicola CBS 121167 TaxID=1176127 RepID=A0A6A6BD80_9PEZI|nr:uncharacterized protein K452DRAFT_358592 [Aplosporella prunicola CBS 121167]KAF2142139.1 hypothetical protein K452DRAFT_358592 [Aplosporella prunicola CBS 121167]